MRHAQYPVCSDYYCTIICVNRALSQANAPQPSVFSSLMVGVVSNGCNEMSQEGGRNEEVDVDGGDPGDGASSCCSSCSAGWVRDRGRREREWRDRDGELVRDRGQQQ